MLALTLVLSLVAGLALGLLGGGGSILTTPILLYGLGMGGREAIATSLVVVGTTSLAALVPHARAGHVVWRTGLTFGAAGMVGAFAGGYAASWFPERVLLLLFAGMMVVTALAMFRGPSPRPEGEAPRAAWRVGVDGLGFGLVTGLVGAGGGFLVVPAMVLLGGLEMAEAVGTSLLVVAMNSAAGFLGHVAHTTIDVKVAAMVSGAAVVGSVVGGALSGRIAPERLRKGFAVFVLVMAAFVVGQQLFGNG